MHYAPPQVRKEHMMHKSKLGLYLLVVLLILLGATGCVTKTPLVQPDYCATAMPIYVSKSDVISDMTARAILEHNLTGQKLCGWGKKAK